MKRIINGIVILVVGFFVGFMVIFRIIDGSFAEAGARFDRFAGFAAEEGGEAAREIADDTEVLIEDIADGPDAKN